MAEKHHVADINAQCSKMDTSAKMSMDAHITKKGTLINASLEQHWYNNIE